MPGRELFLRQTLTVLACARISKLFTSRIKRSLSSTTSLRTSDFSWNGIGGSRRNNSRLPRMVVNGVRNSCETSATKSRCIFKARRLLDMHFANAPNMELNVLAN